MEARNERMVPIIATHPGAILKEELKERNIKQNTFARTIGIQSSHLSEILNAKRNITPDVASKLEQELGISAMTWINLQSQYDYDKVVIQQRSIEEQQAINELSKFNEVCDTKTLMERLGIASGHPQERLQWLKKLICIEHVEQLQLLTSGAFRKSTKVNADPRMILTWALIAKASQSTDTISSVYSHDNDEQMISELVAMLHENTDTINRTKQILNKYGIKFKIVHKVDKAPIDGYSFLDNGIPTIVMTLRFDRIDNFAFTIMHEVGHVVEETTDDIEHLLAAEDSADDFASDKLISRTLWNKAPEERMNIFRIQKAYTSWALQHNLNPWIVIGRISHELGTYKFKSTEDRKIR